MSHEENNLSKGLLIGFLAGGAIGAIFALLYAPKSGKELREDIRNKTDEYMEEADKFIADAKVKAKDVINEGKKKSEKLISDAKVKSEELLKDAEKIFTDAKGKTGSFVSSGKDALDSESSKLKSAFKAGIDAYKETRNQNNEEV
jgi:gas vesicle protein